MLSDAHLIPMAAGGMCGNRAGDYVCTRGKRHDGEHAAHMGPHGGAPNAVAAVWVSGGKPQLAPLPNDAA